VRGAGYRGEDSHRGRVGEDDRAHRDDHRALARQPQLGDDGIGHESVRREEAAEEEGREDPEPEEARAGSEAYREGQAEGKGVEQQGRPALAPQLGDVDLGAGDEEYVHEADRAEEFHRGFLGDEVEGVRPDEDSRERQSDYARQPHFLGEEGRDQYDNEHHGEDSRGIGQGQREGHP